MGLSLSIRKTNERAAKKHKCANHLHWNWSELTLRYIVYIKRLQRPQNDKRTATMDVECSGATPNSRYLDGDCL